MGEIVTTLPHLDPTTPTKQATTPFGGPVSAPARRMDLRVAARSAAVTSILINAFMILRHGWSVGTGIMILIAVSVLLASATMFRLRRAKSV
jgi:hypothetical protein